MSGRDVFSHSIAICTHKDRPILILLYCSCKWHISRHVFRMRFDRTLRTLGLLFGSPLSNLFGLNAQPWTYWVACSLTFFTATVTSFFIKRLIFIRRFNADQTLDAVWWVPWWLMRSSYKWFFGKTQFLAGSHNWVHAGESSVVLVVIRACLLFQREREGLFVETRNFSNASRTPLWSDFFVLRPRSNCLLSMMGALAAML